MPKWRKEPGKHRAPKPIPPKKCAACKGAGVVPDPKIAGRWIDCSSCGGSGQQ